jgi:LPXTG-motif cell wall-anchored protein
MKNSKAVVAMVAIALIIAIGTVAGRTANAATPTEGLRTAASFSLLAGSTPAAAHAVAGVQAPPVIGVQSLPSTGTDGPWSPLMGFGIALVGIGVLLLFGKPVRHP